MEVSEAADPKAHKLGFRVEAEDSSRKPLDAHLRKPTTLKPEALNPDALITFLSG